MRLPKEDFNDEYEDEEETDLSTYDEDIDEDKGWMPTLMHEDEDK